MSAHNSVFYLLSTSLPDHCFHHHWIFEDVALPLYHPWPLLIMVTGFLYFQLQQLSQPGLSIFSVRGAELASDHR
jgi:hypothetical protein